MKKYIKASICLIYSFARFSLIKIIKLEKFKFTLINLISPFTTIEIGKKAKLKLGKFVKIRSGSKVILRKGAEITIGNNTGLNYRCMIIAHEKIRIGHNVQIGPNVLIYDHDHDFRKKDGLKNLIYKTSAVEIGNNVWIGANVVILRGTKIGDNCVIGAGCIIKGIISDNTQVIQKRETTIINDGGVK